MNILFDHNVDRRLRRHLPGHTCVTTRQIRSELLSNGALLRAAAEHGADLFLTVDKKIEYEQNLSALPLPVVVLDSLSNRLEHLAAFAPHLLRALDAGPLPVALHVIARDGSHLRVDQPRPRA